MKKLLLILVFLLSISSIGFAAKADNIRFIVPDDSEYFGSQKISLDNGLEVEISNFRWQEINVDMGKEYLGGKRGLLGIPYTVTITGFTISLSNTSTELMIIKWAESSISIGSSSGIPFIEGMKYQNAGNPAATPNTIIPTGKTIKTQLYLPTAQYDRGWGIIGEPMPKEGTLASSLIMNISDSSNNSKYYTLDIYPLEVVEKGKDK